MIGPSNEGRMSKHLPQLIRYGLVGVVSNMVIYFVYLLITYLGVGPKKAMTVVYIIGVFIGFVANYKWTFTHRGSTTQTAVRYAVASLLGYLLNFTILFIFVDRLGYIHQWVQAVGIIVVAGFLFMLFKYYVFRENIEHQK